MELAQHKKVYARFHSPYKNEGTVKKCKRKVREIGKQEIRAQVEDYENYWYDWQSEHDYDCYYSAPCSTCRESHLRDIGAFDDKLKQWFVEQLIPVTSEFIWDFDHESLLASGFTITYKGATVGDIKAFIDFFTEKNTHIALWLTHDDMGIRKLAMNKLKGAQ